MKICGNGILTVKTTKDGEFMPYFASLSSYNTEYHVPWAAVRSVISSVIIEDGVRSVGENAFATLENLTSVTIGNLVTTIGNYAFAGCVKLTSITIPNPVTTIGNYAFHGCSSLASVTIQNSVTMIGNYAFRGCSSLTSIIIPDFVTTIGSYAFQGCSSLAYVRFGNSVTTIGGESFTGCKLTALTIPNSVTAIGGNAFTFNNNILKDVTVSWIIPLTLGTQSYYNPFGNMNTSDITLHVPAGTESLYRVAPVWKDFKIVTFIVNNESIDNQTLKAYASKGILHITGLSAGVEWSIYNLAGQLVDKGIANAAEEQVFLHANGVYIVTDGSRAIKVMANESY